MTVDDQQERRGGHPFGGCRKLLSQYKTIGNELLGFESKNNGYGYRSFTAFTAFREGVVFVPVEVLESYLEDLLDSEVNEESLFIYSRRPIFKNISISLGGLLGALAVGLYAAYAGASLVLSFGLTALIAVPFAVVWHFLPRSALARRMAFARVLSSEISRRRGRDKDGRAFGSTVFDEIITGKGSGAVQGAARITFH